MNIMQDGFSYVYTFRQPYDRTYYQVQFFWFYSDATTGESYSEFFPPIICSTDHYSQDILTRLENYDLGSGIICPDLSEAASLVKMIGDRYGNTYSYMLGQVMQCAYDADCQEYNTRYNYLYYMEMRYITTNTYYDQLDRLQPIKTYIKVSPSIVHLSGYEATLEFTIAPSQVNFVNGSMSMAYEVKEHQMRYIPVYNTSRMIHLQQATIDPYFMIYHEYYSYQPQLERGSRRQLEESRSVSYITLFLFHQNLLTS